MEVTMKNNQIIPEVLGDMVEQSLGQKITLLPITQSDNTLQGKPGDTLKFPAFRYIGKAEQVDENGQVQAGVLSADTVSATVKKYAKAVRITDEARLSGFGDPVGEAARQLAHAIDHAVDDALWGVLAGAGYPRMAAAAKLTSESVADALTLYGEEQEGDKVLITDAQGFAQLRRDPNYLRAGDLAQQSIFSGAVGEIWGCRIVISSKVKADAAAMEKRHYILRPGALRLVNKTGTTLEVQREPEYMRDTVYCSKHCAAYLYDAGKVICVTEFLGMQTLSPACGITAVPGGAGATRVQVPDDMQPPLHHRWVYQLTDSATPAGKYGTALTAITDCPDGDTDIETGGKGYLHLYLVGPDDKPVKALRLIPQAG